MSELRLGSDEHKKLFCDEFRNTFRTFEVREIRWPQLAEATLARLRAMPFWDEAVKTERIAGARVRLMAEVERDPMLREVIAMQSYEETRHAGILQSLLDHIGVDVPDDLSHKQRDAEWGFLRMGYGEVFDSFFAFGLYRLAGETGFFPPALMETFDAFMDEEARHVIFFVNWAIYRNRNLKALKPWFGIRRALGMSIQAIGRMRTGLAMARGNSAGDDFVMQADAIDADVTLRRLAQTCLEESERRFQKYDPRLARPRLVPKIVEYALRIGPGGR